MTVADELIIRELQGLQPYEPTWQAMQALTANRDADTVDEIWLLQHERVFTQGQAGKTEHLLSPGDIPVVQVDRGGQVTYHGPGQLIVYLMLDLRRRKLGVRELVDIIEQSIVELLADYGINAYPKADAPGVYVNEQKICSLGLRIRRGCSFHGLALNLDMDLEPFLRINPCGYAGLQMTQLRTLAAQAELDAVPNNLVNYLVKKLGYTVLTRTHTHWKTD
ncbi:lipoyl(octanoyl) transferase [Marinobacterium halophilum]|uniref:Octanoyltransferase n=1 Tax=Marinobacterium halophilum TaxID=267374 RepID=A0A2P8ETC1_9GAMM|nr:lipoyl(octanoyl) transferase LipB [Marinobacterium halophilum]PSL12726.1 lipoyl(octanoyl) transferase [Marinobacterium halophilum]